VFILFEISTVHQTQNQFRKTLDVLSSLITTLDIENTDVNVGLATFDESVTLLFSLDANVTTNQLKTGMQNIHRTERNSDVINMLKKVRQEYFNESSGGREEARRLLILFCTGHVVNKERLKREITFCQKANITVIFIATGQDADLDTLFDLASTEHNVIYVENLQNVNNLKSINSYVKYVQCKDDLFV